MANNETVLYDHDGHKCIMFSFDDESHEDSFLSVNQFLIINKDEGILVDPGSEVVFDELYEAVSEHVEIKKIKYIFFSHQDPDVAGSITQWSVSCSAKFVMSQLWVRFMSHYGLMEMSRIVALDDNGVKKLPLGAGHIYFIPAHFLHSPGNFSVYDDVSKVLFSGDIGAAIVGSLDGHKRVEDFNEHLKAMEGFHKRYMTSNRACRRWLQYVKHYDVDTIAPQHGAPMQGEQVEQFYNWLHDLQCGSDIL